MLSVGKLKKWLLNEHTLFTSLLLLINLRIITWFQGDNILSSGDFRIPYNTEAFIQKTLYAWTEIDYGLNSIYHFRILNPLYLLIIIFRHLGLPLNISELIAGYIVYAIAALSMYYIAYKIIGNNIAAFYSAIFLISNVFLVNDREMLALGLITSNLYSALPSIALLIKMIESSTSRLYYLLYMLSIIPIFSSIPNYRPIIVYLAIILILLLYYGVKDGLITLEYISAKYVEVRLALRNTCMLRCAKTALKILLILLLLMLPILISVAPSLEYMLKSYTKVSIPYFAIEKFYIYDILRLIAKWSFYTITVLGKRLVPYSYFYLRNPFLIFLTYIPLVITILTILYAKPRKCALYFGFWYTILLFVMALSKTKVYEVLLSVSLLRVFRGPANWLYIIVFLQSILIGLFISYLTRNFSRRYPRLYSIILGITLMVIVVSAYPLYTGDIALNWVNPHVKGIRFPEEYSVINKYLSHKYWALLLPKRGDYIVYGFNETPANLGNPYPFMFVHPVITGLGLDYVKPGEDISSIIESLYGNVGALSKYLNYYRVMSIGYIVVEKDIILGARYSKIDTRPLKLVVDNKYFSLYSVPGACSKLRSASSVRVYRDLKDMVNEIARARINECSIVFVDPHTYKKLKSILGDRILNSRIISWKQYSPVYYEANAYVDNYLIVVLVESYSHLWSVNIVRGNARVIDHFKVSDGFNAWLIEGKGDVVLAISYGGQKYLEVFYAAIILILSSCIVGSAYYLVGKLNLKTTNVRVDKDYGARV